MAAKAMKAPFLPDPRIPIRDALRGVATLADASQEMLDVAAGLLPAPLGQRFKVALASIEQAGKRLMNSEIEMSQIRAAEEFLSGQNKTPGGIAACASVYAFAWEHLTETEAIHPYLISETVIAERLTRLPAHSGQAGADFAALVVSAIRNSSAVGRMPGLARAVTAEEEDESSLALTAIAVWLLSARSESVAKEEVILDLAVSLIRAMQDKALAAIVDPAQFARFLAETSRHL